jgi:hypothetical protein
MMVLVVLYLLLYQLALLVQLALNFHGLQLAQVLN